jgi:hypothetical protein
MRAVPLVFAVVYLLAAAAAPSAAGPGPGAAPVPGTTSAAAVPTVVRHIRPRDTIAALFLRFGTEKSARFREVVRALEQSNVIVYVEVRQDSNRPVSGGLTFVGEANGIRWVRAMVDSGTPSHLRTCQDIVRLTSILGHELQHALEASQAPTMQNVREFERYFRSIGIDREPRLLDTLAARQTGKQVADELRGMARPRGGVASAAN